MTRRTAVAAQVGNGMPLASQSVVSKTHSNIASGHYKVAGRERQGEDVIHGLHKAKLSRAVRQALKREGRGAASRKSLARQARASAKSRGPQARKAAARKAARTRAR
jgi:hypothetical protein